MILNNFLKKVIFMGEFLYKNMCLSKVRTFLFKCEECSTILSIDFETEEDIKNTNDNKVEIACPCGGKCKVLRN